MSRLSSDSLGEWFCQTCDESREDSVCQVCKHPRPALRTRRRSLVEAIHHERRNSGTRIASAVASVERDAHHSAEAEKKALEDELIAKRSSFDARAALQAQLHEQLEEPMKILAPVTYERTTTEVQSHSLRHISNSPPLRLRKEAGRDLEPATTEVLRHHLRHISSSPPTPRLRKEAGTVLSPASSFGSSDDEEAEARRSPLRQLRRIVKGAAEEEPAFPAALAPATSHLRHIPSSPSPPTSTPWQGAAEEVVSPATSLGSSDEEAETRRSPLRQLSNLGVKGGAAEVVLSPATSLETSEEEEEEEEESAEGSAETRRYLRRLGVKGAELKPAVLAPAMSFGSSEEESETSPGQLRHLSSMRKGAEEGPALELEPAYLLAGEESETRRSLLRKLQRLCSSPSPPTPRLRKGATEEESGTTAETDDDGQQQQHPLDEEAAAAAEDATIVVQQLAPALEEATMLPVAPLTTLERTEDEEIRPPLRHLAFSSTASEEHGTLPLRRQDSPPPPPPRRRPPAAGKPPPPASPKKHDGEDRGGPGKPPPPPASSKPGVEDRGRPTLSAHLAEERGGSSGKPPPASFASISAHLTEERSRRRPPPPPRNDWSPVEPRASPPPPPPRKQDEDDRSQRASPRPPPPRKQDDDWSRVEAASLDFETEAVFVDPVAKPPPPPRRAPPRHDKPPPPPPPRAISPRDVRGRRSSSIQRRHSSVGSQLFGLLSDDDSEDGASYEKQQEEPSGVLSGWRDRPSADHSNTPFGRRRLSSSEEEEEEGGLGYWSRRLAAAEQTAEDIAAGKANACLVALAVASSARHAAAEDEEEEEEEEDGFLLTSAPRHEDTELRGELATLRRSCLVRFDARLLAKLNVHDLRRRRSPPPR